MGYITLRLLETRAMRLGVLLANHYDYPVTRFVMVGNSWETQTYTSEQTESWVLLAILSGVTAVWLGHAVFHRNIRAAFSRRWLWIMAGWLIIVALTIVGLRLIQPVDLPFIPLLIVLGLLGRIWMALMRACGVPERDAYSDPDF